MTFAATFFIVVLLVAVASVALDPATAPITVISVSFAAVGALITARGRTNRIGWCLCFIGLMWGVSAFGDAYDEHPSLPGAAAGPAGAWALAVGPPATFMLLLFPDGRLVSARWRPVAWAAAISILAVTVVISLADVGRAPAWAAFLAVTALFASAVGSVASLVVRFRRSRGVERQQLKWFTFAGGLVIGLWLSAIPDWEFAGLIQSAFLVSLSLIPIAVGIAILRYRLYDIDLVINKALVFGALAAFITAVYVAIVVGVSALVGRAGEPNLALSLLATAVVAVAFQPARERAQRLANRLVYGQRATPYEVLSAFSAQAAATVASEEVLPKVAKTVAEGTGAARSEVWVASGPQLRLAAAWPERGQAARPLPLENGRLPALPEVDLAVPVSHQGELLGALAVRKPRGDPLTPQEEKLLSDLAAQAGLVLRNVGLTAELLARLEELRASRQRLVSAQDAARRRLERDLHDGAQQHLVGLKVKLNLAARQAEDARLKQALISLQQDTDETIVALRELAHGIYPPLLAEQGVAAALEPQARKAPLAVAIEAENLARYPQELEAAVYFCCLEALQNASKYANASQASIRLVEAEGELRFAVADDGLGFDPAETGRGSGLQNMADRLEALGGTLAVESEPGAGTRVEGRLPLADGTAGETRSAAAPLYSSSDGLAR